MSLRSDGTRNALAPQQQFYTLVLRDAGATGMAREHPQLLGAVTEVLVAPEQPAAVLAHIAAPTTRIVSLTITVKGCCHDPASGRLRLEHPDTVHDLVAADRPRSAICFPVLDLALRRAAGGGPLTLMSLDTLPASGQMLREAVPDFARARDTGLADWISTGCRFPCSMVARMVPRTTDADRSAIASALGTHDAWPVLAELFSTGRWKSNLPPTGPTGPAAARASSPVPNPGST